MDVGSTGHPSTTARWSRDADLARRENKHGSSNRNGEDEDVKEEQTDSEAEHDQRLEDAWARLQAQRAAVRQLRLHLDRRRRHLQRLETRVEDADNAFMSLCRDDIANGGSYHDTTKAFLQRLQVLQGTRDEYRSEQTEVQQLEDQLAEAEMDSEARETEFFGILLWQETTPPPTVAGVHSHDPRSRTSLLGIPSDRPPDLHPLFKQLMGVIGHRENLKEHHSELIEHRGSILFDLELAIRRERLRGTEGRPDKRGAVVDNAEIAALTSITRDPERMNEELGRFKSQIGSYNWSFLVEFPERETRVIGEMAAATAQVNRLRQLCIDRRLLRKHLSCYDEYIIFADTGKAFQEETISISPEELPRQENFRFRSRFPVLQSNPRYIFQLDTPFTALKRAIALPKDDPSRPQQVADAIKEHSISTLLSETKAEDKSEFINRWLLQRLRTSSLEIALLYTVFVFVTRLQARNATRWQEDVLFFWSRDACNYPKEHFRGQVTARSSSVIDDPAGPGISDSWSGASPYLGSTDSTSNPPNPTNENPEPSEVEPGEGTLAPETDRVSNSGASSRAPSTAHGT